MILIPFMVGVYTWANGDRARITFRSNKIIFGNRLIFAESDACLEYRGGLREGHLMHG